MLRSGAKRVCCSENEHALSWTFDLPNSRAVPVRCPPPQCQDFAASKGVDDFHWTGRLSKVLSSPCALPAVESSVYVAIHYAGFEVHRGTPGDLAGIDACGDPASR